MRAIVSCPLVVVVLAASAPRASASDIHVPADYSTIQSAIDAAVDGDAVLVAPGTYAENIDFKGKAITVKSADGPVATIIDGGGLDSVARFVSGETRASILEGFTLTNGQGMLGAGDGGGVVCYAINPSGPPSSPTILGNIIRGNHAAYGAGIYSTACSPLIVSNFIFDNHSTCNGAGLWVANGAADGSSPLIVNNTVTGNQPGCDGAGIWTSWSSYAVITNCIFWGDDVSKNEIQGDSSITVTYCDVAGGYAGAGNIDVDPMFVDPANGDLHLLPGSPCADVGDSAALGLPALDIDGDPRVLFPSVDLGGDERLDAPFVYSVSPERGKYGSGLAAAIHGGRFSIGGPINVRFGTLPATNVSVIDDAHLTCDAPAGDPGPVEVGVSSAYGEGLVAGGFTYTPAVTVTGDSLLGSTITIHDLCDPGDGIFAVYGLPPQTSIPTPPFDSDLAIVPFHYFFYVSTWPFDSFDVPATIPNDPALVGVDVLLQSLIGPQLTKPPKDGSWTNCATITIH